MLGNMLSKCTMLHFLTKSHKKQWLVKGFRRLPRKGNSTLLLNVVFVFSTHPSHIPYSFLKNELVNIGQNQLFEKYGFRKSGLILELAKMESRCIQVPALKASYFWKSSFELKKIS